MTTFEDDDDPKTPSPITITKKRDGLLELVEAHKARKKDDDHDRHRHVAVRC